PLRQLLFFAYRLKKPPTSRAAGFRGGLRIPDIRDIELRRGRILTPQPTGCKGNFVYFPPSAAKGTASAIAA
ncbi:hypothetical protein, partial [Paraburkholderia mimosarum]|uniref:hypothetical protein n=2 Tax=Paraburkholderia mimosarum TaxID=312026 RepID=UPI001ABAF549